MGVARPGEGVGRSNEEEGSWDATASSWAIMASSLVLISAVDIGWVANDIRDDGGVPNSFANARPKCDVKQGSRSLMILCGSLYQQYM